MRQIKENFAGLRFYVRERSLADVRSVQAEDAILRLRALIGDVTAESEGTCQRCGHLRAVHNVDGLSGALWDAHLKMAEERHA